MLESESVSILESESISILESEIISILESEIVSILESLDGPQCEEVLRLALDNDDGDVNVGGEQRGGRQHKIREKAS